MKILNGKLLMLVSSLIALSGCDFINHDKKVYMLVPDVCKSNVMSQLEKHDNLVDGYSYEELELFIPKKLDSMHGNFSSLVSFDLSKIPNEKMFTNDEYLSGFFDNCLYKKRKKIDLLNLEDILELQQILEIEGETVKYVRHLEDNSVMVFWGEKI